MYRLPRSEFSYISYLTVYFIPLFSNQGEVDVQTAELKHQVKCLQNDLDLAVKSEKTARKNEQDARKEHVEQVTK